MSSRHKLMAESVAALRAGTISFPEFQRRTLTEWTRVARWLMRRWETPDGVEEHDVVQELLLAAWHFTPKWDPKYGTQLSGYVVWNACDKAKKWIHTQRRAARRDDSAPSRHPVSLSSLGLEEWQEERLAVVEPDVDRGIEQLDQAEGRARVVARLAQVAPFLSRFDCHALAVLVDANGDVEEAARDLWENPTTRLAFRLGSETGAQSAVHAVLQRTQSALASQPR